ncbi:MAG: isopentenyl-diphosphate Delta-isomerase [Hyphomonas sp.]
MNDQHEQVILVDEADRAVQPGDKWNIHRQGLLHRAFSIFIFNSHGDCLIQKRAAGKYHSAGKWANSCCGHPRPGEATGKAARRRLEEETGLRVPLYFGFKARYVARLDNEMIENEIPHLYFGRSETEPSPNPDEIEAIDWISLTRLEADIRQRPDRYAAWLCHYVQHHGDALHAWRDRT